MMHIRNELRERMSGASLETLLKLFEFDKKAGGPAFRISQDCLLSTI
jgi:hypothetical protein